MQDFKIEDSIILIDSSRSMLRRDFKPNRLNVALNAVINFIQAKFTIDPKDRIAIVSFGDNTKRLSLFTYDEKKLVESLQRIQISGKGILHDGLAFSLQLIVAEMRKLGGKTYRIFIISDNKIKYSEKVFKIVEIAKGLGVYIDSCQLGKSDDYSKSILKKIAKITGGQYGFFNNSKGILNAGKEYASKKEFKESIDYFSPNKEKNLTPLVSEIALPLRRPTFLDIRLMMNNNDHIGEKCQICHSIKSPITKGDFYSEGRYCPSCDRPMHLSCAAIWAKKTEEKENVFRCPFCFFLLELPKSTSKLIEEKDDSAPKIRLIDEGELKTTKMNLMPDGLIRRINSSCSYCYSIFLGDYKVYKCEKCGSFYHEPCLKKMYNEIKGCRNCGAQIINE
ncbi:MAG: VWA domain-containing protein [Promethearchaeota archaeon]